jgi:excisionase family DNA binding protein
MAGEGEMSRSRTGVGREEEGMDRLVLSPEEAAEVLGVGKSTIYDLLRANRLRSVKIGRRRLIPVGECEEFLNSLPTEPVW